MQHDTDLAIQLRSLSLERAPAAALREAREPIGRRRPRLGRWMASAALAAILAAGGAALLLPDETGRAIETVAGLVEPAASRSAAETPPAAAPAAAPAPAPATVVGSGFVVADRSAVVSASEGGRLAALPLEVGDAFRAGDTLAEIDLPERRAELALAEAKRDRARAVIGHAEAVLAEAFSTQERAERLVERGAGTPLGREEAGFAAERARLDLDLARQDERIAALEVARLEAVVAHGRITAPFDGIVVERLASPGALIPSGMQGGDPNQSGVLRILDPAALGIVVDVAESRIGAIEPGQAATAALDAATGHDFAMRVEAVTPEASVQKGTVPVRLTFEEAPPVGRVLANMAAKVTFAAAQD